MSKQRPEIMNCAICGAKPRLIKESLDRGNGHGYPGAFEYQYVCDNCEIPEAEVVHDIYAQYNPKLDVITDAIESWNKENQYIENFLKQKEKVK